jgi:hypothetical protein
MQTMRAVWMGACCLAALAASGLPGQAMAESGAAQEACVQADKTSDKSKACAESKPKPKPRRAPPLLQDAPPRQEAPRREAVPIVPPNVTVPSPPPTITSCDGGGCWDAGGGRYSGNTGVGPATTPPAAPGGAMTDNRGRLCTTNGAFVQCF